MSDFLFIAFLLVAFFEFTHDVIEIDARVLPHYKQMIEKVTGLVYDLFFVLMLVGDDDFRGFFADLLVDLVFAFALQVIGVGLILRMGAAIFDFFKKSMKDRKASCFFPVFPLCKASEEAGGMIRMAGRARPSSRWLIWYASSGVDLPSGGATPDWISSARLSFRGSSFPRSKALRRMPRQAFLVK